MRGILRTSLATMLLALLAACGEREAATPAGAGIAAANDGDAAAAILEPTGDAATPRDARVAAEDGERLDTKTGRESPEARHRRGDPACARIQTRTRNVASVSGGPMQMIMVTECVPAGK